MTCVVEGSSGCSVSVSCEWQNMLLSGILGKLLLWVCNYHLVTLDIDRRLEFP
jgi:hypothetical protein